MVKAEHLSVRYEQTLAVEDLSFTVEKGCVATLIGPNGCGKSTILKAIARNLKPARGRVLLDGKDMAGMGNREIARKLAFLPQQRTAPSDFTVQDMVEYGRSPFLRFGGWLGKEDREVVDWAIGSLNLRGMEGRWVSSLSGGERQRVWIAMCLAQRPELLLLDEPTTYLDIACQYETLRLVQRLNRELGLTILMVLHDLNQAARFSQTLLAVRGGRLVKAGTVGEILTAPVIREVFGVEGIVSTDPVTGLPMFLPGL